MRPFSKKQHVQVYYCVVAIMTLLLFVVPTNEKSEKLIYGGYFSILVIYQLILRYKIKM